MNAARVLAEARRRAGLTQRELASRAGVHQPLIARIERGNVVPRVDTLDKLLHGCGERLSSVVRSDIGVDRSQIYELRRLEPVERARVAERGAKGLYRLMSEAKKAGASRALVGEFPATQERIVTVLGRHGVRYVMIGASAARLHGSPVITADIDICFQRDDDNFDRLALALRELGATLRGKGIPPDLPSATDPRFLRNGDHFTFATDAGDLDCMMTPSGIEGGYDELRRNAMRLTLFGYEVEIAAVSDLLRMKRAAGRDKDRAHIPHLEALQAEIDSEQDG